MAANNQNQTGNRTMSEISHVLSPITIELPNSATTHRVRQTANRSLNNMNVRRNNPPTRTTPGDFLQPRMSNHPPESAATMRAPNATIPANSQNKAKVEEGPQLLICAESIVLPGFRLT